MHNQKCFVLIYVQFRKKISGKNGKWEKEKKGERDTQNHKGQKRVGRNATTGINAKRVME